jgi:orotate phosphoribosyltransferase
MALDPVVRSSLAELVLRTGYERRDEPFQLTSGGWSHDYVDGKHAVALGADLGQACQAVGADALAHGVAMLSGSGWFSVRKEPKGHGRGAWVEGTRLGPDDRVVVVEDVVSTGASLLRAVERIRDLGADVVAATALLDRSPVVGPRFAEAGVRWAPLLTWADLGIEPL